MAELYTFCGMTCMGASIGSSERIDMTKYLHIGGLVAAGIDPSGAFLLTVSHSAAFRIIDSANLHPEITSGVCAPSSIAFQA